MSLFKILLVWALDLINSETVLYSQSTDYTLTLANSPYIVNSFVTFSSSSHIVVENGVQIIFIGNKFISIFGSLDCGCSASNAINNSTKGLSNHSSFVHLFGNESMPTSTGIFINQQSSSNPPIIQFCNTLFDNIQNGIVTTSNQYAPYTVHNCEFRYINNAIHHTTNIINYVYNSYFHEINNVKSAGGIIYDHCLFHSFGKFSFDTARAMNIAIRNSEIYGDDAQICLNINSVAGDPTYAIYNNTISRCKDGIEIWNAVTIARNTISNCSRYGIFAKDVSDTLDITENIFTNNGQLDIMLDDVQSANIFDNRFQSDTSSIFMDGLSCEMSNIQQNHFSDLHPNDVSLSHEYIVTVRDCVDINIAHNTFIDKYHTYGAIYCEGDDDRNIKTVFISSNLFMNNSFQYLITMEQTTLVVMDNNIISHLNIYGHLLESANSNKISLSYNTIQHNMAFHTPLINVQNTNHFKFEYNQMEYNEINDLVSYPSHFIHSESNLQVIMQRNVFTANTGTNTNLLYLHKSYSTHIAHNTFDGNALSPVLYLDYLHDVHFTEHILIAYNDFVSSATYIEIDGNAISDPQIQINWNNFHDHNSTQYFLLSDSQNIDADHNYWSGRITYAQIAQKVPDICATVHISNANEDPINMTDNGHIENIASQCVWTIADNCSTITDYTCDSYTTQPTISPITTIPSTIAPTKRIIIASVSTTRSTTTSNTKHTTNTEDIDASSGMLLPQTIVIRQKNDSSFVVLMICASIGCAVICLVSCEIVWCLRKQNEKEKLCHAAVKHHLSFSDSYKVNFNDIALHAVQKSIFPAQPPIPYMLTKTTSAVFMDDLKEAEEEDIFVETGANDTEEDEVEGDCAPIVSMKGGRYHVNDETVNHLGEVDAEEELRCYRRSIYDDSLGIKIKPDEFLIGSLPKITQSALLGEGEDINESMEDCTFAV